MAYRWHMAPEASVVEDGTGETRVTPTPKPGWFLAIVGFGLGLALGTLIAGPTQTSGAPVSTQPTTPVTTAEPSEDRADAGVSGAVPGFPDALVAVGDSIGSGHDHLLWPVSGSLVNRAMTGGRDIDLDASSIFVALTEAVPDLAGSLLSMGRFNAIRPLSTGVTSYSWHDSTSGYMAYTTEVGEEWRMYRVSGSFEPTLITRGSLEGASVAAWGDWGFAVQLPDGRIQLLTSQGELKDVKAGMALTSHESGWILVADEGLKLVSAGGGVRILDRPEVPETVFAASFSPDGSRVAVVGNREVVVYDVDDAEATITAAGFQGGWVTWSSDSSFLVAPARSGVFIHDLEKGESHQVLVGHSILTAGVLPLSTS